MDTHRWHERKKRGVLPLIMVGWLLVLAGVPGCQSSGKAKAGAEAAVAPTPVVAAPAEEMPDYATKLAEWVGAHQDHPDEQNRWPEFVDGAARLAGAWEYFVASDGPIAGYIAEDPDKHYGAGDPGVLVGDPDYARFLPELRRFFAALDRTKVLFQLDDLTGPSRFVALRATEPLMETAMPEVGRSRLGVKICAARMRLMLMDGRPEQAVRSLAHMLAIARGVRGRGMLITDWASEASWSVAGLEVIRNLVSGRVDAPTARAMLAVLSEDSPPDPRVALGGERFVCLDVIDRFFLRVKEETAARENAALTPTQEHIPDDGVGILVPRDEQIAQANRFFDGCDRLFGKDEGERERGGADVDAVTALVHDRSGGRMYKPLDMTLPNLEGAREIHQRTMAYLGGARAMLALELFRIREGHYPEKLADLVPGEIDAIPPDPFATSATLRYRRTQAEGGTAADAYLLYSVGYDGEDNGGKAHPTNPSNAAGRGSAGRGYDLIINSRDW
jgi:hypothetical protein